MAPSIRLLVDKLVAELLLEIFSYLVNNNRLSLLIDLKNTT